MSLTSHLEETTSPVAFLGTRQAVQSTVFAHSTVFPPRLLYDFCARLDAEVAALRPLGRRLGPRAEEKLARYCLCLAALEQWYRNPVAVLDMIDDGRGPFAGLTASTDFPGFWNVATVDDVRALSWAFWKTQSALLAGGPAILNPNFAGSVDVGGADGDLILDNTLLEIKTRREAGLQVQDIRQLLGYVFLDYNDVYKLRRVGFSMARQAVLVTWDLTDLLARLSGRREKLKKWRQTFREVVIKCAPTEGKGDSATTASPPRTIEELLRVTEEAEDRWRRIYERPRRR